MANVVIIDGNSIINKAYYGIRGMTNSEGFPTNAMFGFMKIFDRILSDIEPQYVGVCFDLKGGTFRNELYSEYKANRTSMDMDLALQLPVLKELLRAMGYRLLEKQGYEADDLIGTLSYAFSRLGHSAYILTGDRDALQLVGNNRFVCYHGNKEKLVYDAEKVKTDFGVEPEKIPDLKGLKGDNSDNIPGVKGIGNVTALKLLESFGSLEEILERSDEIKPERVRKLIENDREMAVLSKKLATIDCAVEIDFRPEDYLIGEENLPHLMELLKKYELRMLEAKFRKKLHAREKSGFAHRKAEVFSDPSDLNVFNFSEPIFIDLIKDDANPLAKGFDYLIFYQKGAAPLLFDSEAGEFVFAKLREESEKSPLVFKAYRLKEWMLLLRANGIERYQPAFDLSIVQYLIDPNRTDPELSEISEHYLQVEIPSLSDLYEKRKKTKSLELVDFAALSDCLAQRVQAIEALEEVMLGDLKERGLFHLYEEIERPLSSVLVDMQVAGFKVDLEELKRIDAELGELLFDIEQQIYFMAGKEFNINSPKQLGKILFEDLGLKSLKNNKTGQSTSKEVLEKLRRQNPIVDKILLYRMYSKLKSVYSEGLQASVNVESGAIHSYLEQTVASTGRISSRDPNLQNIPIRYEMGRELRKAFVARDEDHLILSADYSQIELRILAHLSGDEKMIFAYREGIDIHALTASQIFEKDLDQIAPAERTEAKAINFGIIYGMGKYSLSEDLHISFAEAEAYINNYFAKYPTVKSFLDKCKEDAAEKGYAITLFGRKRPVPELKSKNFNLREYGKRIAMNAPIQGSSADLIKIAMIRVNEGLKAGKFKSRLIMQIHDELLIDTHKDEYEEVKKLLIDSMKNACQLEVPLNVDVSSGRTWYEAK